MKVFAVIVATIGLVALAHASKEYHLKCTREEMGIRWPSYEHHSEYFVCPRIGGKQMTVSCNLGEVFTFVLQSCTSPSKYIPAPALEILPTASPILAAVHGSHHKHDDGMPKPLTMTHGGQQPPILIAPQPPVFESAHVKPAVHIPEQYLNHAVQHHENLHHHHEKPEPIDEPKHIYHVDPQPEHHEVKPQDLPPMPPTPAPTPPVVAAADNKKPLNTPKKPIAGQKKPAAKPAKDEKKKPAVAEKLGKKTPAKPSKQAPKKAAPAPKGKKVAPKTVKA